MFFKPFVLLLRRTVSRFAMTFCVLLGVMAFVTCMVSAQIQTMPKGAQAVTVVANAATPIKGPRRIAVILPVSGPYASMGVLLQQGYSLGEAVIKQSVLKNAEIRYFDSGQFKDIQTLVSEQVAPWEPDVIVGPYTSEEALALDRAARALQIPVITPIATLDKLNQNAQGMVYRLAPPQYKIAQTARSFLQSVWQDWGIDKVMILTEETPFGRQAAQTLVGSFATQNMITPQVLAYRPGSIGKSIENLSLSENTVVMMLGRSTDDARKVVNRFEKTHRIIGLYGAFTTPAFRLYALAQSADARKGLYVVSPWQSKKSNEQVIAFDTRFRNMFKGALDHAIPQSHSAQAYTAMLVAGHALADARESQSDVFSALNTLVIQSPLGEIRFIDYGGYHRQATVATSVQQYQGAVPHVVYPLIAINTQTPLTEPIPRGTIRTLLENQILALFVIIALGLGLGAISFRGISLGSSGVLFIALIFGHYGLSIPNKIGTLGLILFVYGVGLGAGPGFFRAFVTQGKNLAKLGIVLVTVGTVCTYVCAKIFDIPSDLAVGIFAGSMTSTPALAAAIDSLKDSGPLASIGYGVAYPFGVVGVVLFVQLLPKFLKVDLDKLSTEISSKTDKNKMIMRVLVKVTNPAAVGKHLIDLDFIQRASCQVVRVKKDQRMVPVTPELVFEAGTKVLLIGTEENLDLVVNFLGSRSDEPFFMDTDHERRTVVVTSNAFVGRSLRGLDVLRKYSVSVSRIVRNDVGFVPQADTIIQRADALTIVGESQNMDRFAEEAGHRAKALDQTDILSLAVGIALGVILGKVPLGLGTGASFVLGMTGGPLFVALILGHFGRIGFITGHMPRASRLLMTELGLVFFLIGAGVKAGGAFVQVVQEHGIKLFVMGMIITAVPLIIGFPIARKCLKLNLLQTLGGTCGGMTSTPGLGAITAKTDSEIPVVSYATAYPVALILMTVCAQIIISLLS